MSMPNHQFMRLPAVMSTVGRSRSSIYQDIQKKTFPAPIKIGPRAVAWSSISIIEWQEGRINAAKTA
ncbi:helix-turn-helix transcriptional regulator [Actimicrobium sp. CCI2.3]|uniref:helix-turn-helix transcriptional regulator n=2 Tax=Actimicrobium sp. CCI2.3 TaxID=3048616 RepID=UPI002B249BDE|nr:AlpA family phage regulatory protein [Actimicrobium sp. CCI2.3]